MPARIVCLLLDSALSCHIHDSFHNFAVTSTPNATVGILDALDSLGVHTLGTRATLDLAIVGREVAAGTHGCRAAGRREGGRLPRPGLGKEKSSQCLGTRPSCGSSSWALAGAV